MNMVGRGLGKSGLLASRKASACGLCARQEIVNGGAQGQASVAQSTSHLSDLIYCLVCQVVLAPLHG